MRAIILGLSFVLVAASTDRPLAQQQAGAPALVVLVRHAEPAAAPEGDPALNDIGKARAQDLAGALHDAGIAAIVTFARAM